MTTATTLTEAAANELKTLIVNPTRPYNAEEGVVAYLGNKTQMHVLVRRGFIEVVFSWMKRYHVKVTDAGREYAIAQGWIATPSVMDKPATDEIHSEPAPVTSTAIKEDHMTTEIKLNDNQSSFLQRVADWVNTDQPIAEYQVSGHKQRKTILNALVKRGLLLEGTNRHGWNTYTLTERGRQYATERGWLTPHPAPATSSSTDKPATDEILAQAVRSLRYGARPANPAGFAANVQAAIDALQAENETLRKQVAELQARIDGVAAMQPLSMSRALSEQYAIGYNMALGKVQSRLGVESEDTAS